MKIKKIICLLLAFTVVFAISGCGKKNGVTILPPEYDSETMYSFPESQVLADAGDYTLSFDGKYGSPVIKSTVSEKEWSVLPADFLDKWNYEFGTPISQSQIFIKIYDPTYESFFTINSSDAVAQDRIKVEEITNGLRITYFFDEYKISVPVYYTVTENGLSIKVSAGEIEEHDFPVMSVAVAPFLCSAKNTTDKDHYLLIPSGSGALMYTDERGTVRQYEEEVFGVDMARENKWQYTNSEQIYLPVFGAVDGDSAMYGIISSGAESSSIGAHVGNTDAGYSGVYPIFHIRSYNNVEIDIGGTTGLKTFLRLAEDRNLITFEAQYRILSGEDASYSGMANAYRDYLGLESGVKNKQINISLLGGVMANRSALGIPYKVFSPTTTFNAAGKIVNELYSQNKTAMNIRLLGFGKTGLDVEKLAGGFAFNSRLGSKSDIESFNNAANKSGSSIFVDYDVLQFSKSGNGYSKRGDVTVDTTDYRVKKYKIDISLRNVDESAKISYLLARASISNVVDDAIKATNKTSIKGISLSTLGVMAYSDFSNEKYFGKLNMAGDVSEALKKVNAAKLNLATASSNVYAAVLSDYIDCIPTKSSNFSVFDVDIPFYAIVFSGCKENAVSVNLSSVPRKEFLNALKTGAGLSFVIADDINEDALASMNSVYIAASYDYNKQLINDYLTESREFLNKVSGVSVKQHNILDNGLSQTVFENGITIYVNESVEDVTYNGEVIKAMSFNWR